MFLRNAVIVSENNKICLSCGYFDDLNDKFCLSCGTRLISALGKKPPTSENTAKPATREGKAVATMRAFVAPDGTVSDSPVSQS